MNTRTRLKSLSTQPLPPTFSPSRLSIPQAIGTDRTLCKIALDPKGKVQGCIRFFKCGLIKEDGTISDAILLGPLSVSTANRGRGLAHQLIQHSLAEARARRLGPCFVVGDPKIYRKHGFCNATSLNITLEGQDDLRRFLVAELDIGQFSQQMRDSALVPLS